MTRLRVLLLGLVAVALAAGAVEARSKRGGIPSVVQKAMTFNGNVTMGGVDSTGTITIGALGSGSLDISGATLNVNTMTTAINIGAGASITSSGRVFVDGQADVVQLLAQGNGTQTARIFVAELSTGTDVFGVGTTGVFTTGTGEFSGALSANGGIIFDNIADTIGSHTAGGDYNMATNLLLNIGDAGTDFGAGGALTLAGALVANGVVQLGDGGDAFSVASTGMDVSTGGALSGVTDLQIAKSAGASPLLNATAILSTATALTIQLRTGTANVKGLAITYNQTADVDAIEGLAISGAGTHAALGVDNMTRGLYVQGIANASDDAGSFRFGVFSDPPAVATGSSHSVGYAIGGVAFGAATEWKYGVRVYGAPSVADFDMLDHAGTFTHTNTVAGAEAFTWTEGDGLAGGAGSTFTLNLSSGQGAGANGGMTTKIGNAGTGGAGVFLVEADTGEDGYRASCASTGVCTLNIGNATAKFAIDSDAVDISLAGAITGATGLTLASGTATLPTLVSATSVNFTSATLAPVATASIPGFMSAAQASTLAALGTASTGAVPTTDATVTTCQSVTPTDAMVTFVRSYVEGRKSDGTAGASYLVMSAFRRAGATITQISITNPLVTFEDDVTWNATHDISGTTVRVRVTGVAATTVDWDCQTESTEGGP